MTARSHRLVGPLELAPGVDTLLYIVPDGRTALVKTLRVVNSDADVSLFDLTVGALEHPNALHWQTTIAVRSILNDTTWTVLEAGETLRARASAVPVVVTVSGVLLIA